MRVEERPVSAASPEVAKDDDTGDSRVRAPHRGKGISLDCVDNQENCQVCRSKDNHHPDLREKKSEPQVAITHKTATAMLFVA